MACDPDESYDVAPENPQIVAQLQEKISKMIGTFPESGQKPGPGSRLGAQIRPCR
jgi:hypothetical protein